MTHNRGVNLQLEALHIDPETDWKFGAASPACLYNIPMEKREQYLPKGEVQVGAEDTVDCATRGPTNKLETKFTFAHKTGLMKAENRQWGIDKGYADAEGNWTFSDAFNAILSNTTRQGNSLIAPIDSMHTNGMVPKKLLPLDPGMTWDEYHNPARITQELKDLGKEFLQRWPLNYERVPAVTYKDALKKDMVSVAVYAWPTPVDGIYHSDIASFNHCVLNYSLQWFIFDNYLDYDENTGTLQVPDDFIKQLAPDYKFFEYGYRIYVSNEMTPSMQPIPQTVFEVLKKNGLLAFFADWWERFQKNVGWKK